MENSRGKNHQSKPINGFTNSSGVAGRLGRLWVIKQVNPDSIGTIAHNNFRWRANLIFSSLPKSVRNITDVDICVYAVAGFFLRTLLDSPTEPFFDNSVNRRIENVSPLMLLWWASDDDFVR